MNLYSVRIAILNLTIIGLISILAEGYKILNISYVLLMVSMALLFTIVGPIDKEAGEQSVIKTLIFILPIVIFIFLVASTPKIRFIIAFFGVTIPFSVAGLDILMQINGKGLFAKKEKKQENV